MYVIRYFFDKSFVSFYGTTFTDGRHGSNSIELATQLTFQENNV
jgi:hypothetical protein